jgi:predicted nuclease of predicted toxin-antitoxin system
MKLWLDAQLSPALAKWMSLELNVEAVAVRDLGLRDAKDTEIFQQAKKADVVMMTKDSDFVILLERYGPPPRVLWITCGNTSNQRMQQILRLQLSQAVALFDAGEALVEISEPR